MVAAFVSELRSKAIEARSEVLTSPLVDKLSAALAKAQGTMRHPKKSKTAKVPLKAGGGFEYDYADLADVFDAIREPFAQTGLAVVQIPVVDLKRGAGVITRLMHESGQWIESVLLLPFNDDKPQTIGSAITYARRYALSPMTGVASEYDDDGNAAQGQQAETAPRQQGGQKASSTGTYQRGETRARVEAEAAQNVIYQGTDEQKKALRKQLNEMKLSNNEQKAVATAMDGKPMSKLGDVIKNTLERQNADK